VVPVAVVTGTAGLENEHFVIFLVQRDPCPTSAVRGQPDAFFDFLSPVVLLEGYINSPVLTTSQLGLSLFQSLS